MALNAVVKESSRIGNVDGSFDLVSGQDPDFDAGLANKLYGILYLILELIFNGCRAYELHSFFDPFIHIINHFLTVF